MNRKTIARKLIFLAIHARTSAFNENLEKSRALVIEFDDLETFEHTKYKPLSLIMAIESGSRRILGFEVTSMPANGKLAKIARKKYGPRKDERRKGRRSLLKHLIPLVDPKALFKSDKNPTYPKDLKDFFPKAHHKTFKGRRGANGGQGELKKIGFDPIFSINHSFAMLRANINRLFRRTWCTTKKADRLSDHVALYILFHNRRLKPVE